jgi:hypothetical protein
MKMLLPAPMASSSLWFYRGELVPGGLLPGVPGGFVGGKVWGGAGSPLSGGTLLPGGNGSLLISIPDSPGRRDLPGMPGSG